MIDNDGVQLLQLGVVEIYPSYIPILTSASLTMKEDSKDDIGSYPDADAASALAWSTSYRVTESTSGSNMDIDAF